VAGCGRGRGRQAAPPSKFCVGGVGRASRPYSHILSIGGEGAGGEWGGVAPTFHFFSKYFISIFLCPVAVLRGGEWEAVELQAEAFVVDDGDPLSFPTA